MNNIRNILKHSFRLLLIVVLSAFATEVASAKTITSSSNLIDESFIMYANNIYDREDYKNYLLAQEYIGSGYNYTTYYYLCLTNDAIDTSNTLNVNATCDIVYRYYRNSGVYVIEKLSDNQLNVSNSIYYSKTGKNYIIEKLLITISIGILTFYLTYVIFKIFRG